MSTFATAKRMFAATKNMVKDDLEERLEALHPTPAWSEFRSAKLKDKVAKQSRSVPLMEMKADIWSDHITQAMMHGGGKPAGKSAKDLMREAYETHAKQQAMQQAMHMAQFPLSGVGAGVFGQSGAGAQTSSYGQEQFSSDLLLEMIRMRLRTGQYTTSPGNLAGFDYASAHKHNSDTVFLFLVINGKPVTIEDDWGLFPSDTLVTQLRTLVG